MKILNFGSCNIDYVYSLDHIVLPGETETGDRLDIFAGGKGLNQSVAIAKAGATVYHAGCIGSDGEMLAELMSESGVDVSYIARTEEKNGHAIIQVSKDGENSIFLYPGSNNMITKEYINSVLENFGKNDIILLQNEINNVDYIIEKAYEKGMCIILNPSPFNESLKGIDFNKLSYIALNKVEAKMLSGLEDSTESLRYIKNKYPKLKVLLTVGVKGSIYSDNETELFQPSFKVEAVDTTAAGDTFTGYFVAELAKGTDYARILELAAAASAIAVSRNGAAPSIPTMDEVLSEIDTMQRNN